MKIDVAIAREKDRSDRMIEHSQLHCVTQEFFSDIEYHKQLAEWLEELKNIREENAYLHCEMQAIGATIDMLEEEIRNRAIDDFMKECKEEYDNDGCPNVADYLDYKISIRDLCKIAEQLKAGGIDGNERTDT